MLRNTCSGNAAVGSALADALWDVAVQPPFGHLDFGFDSDLGYSDFGFLNDRSPKRRPPPRRASETVIGDVDFPLQIRRRIKIANIPRRVVADAHVHRAIEIAVIQRAIPADVKLVAAHQAVQRAGVEAGL